MQHGDLQQIDISQLKPGMFVVKVVSRGLALKVKTEGLVRTATTIENLTKAGVRQLWIDPDRSEVVIEDASSPSETPPQTDPGSPAQVSFEDEMNQALSLYQEAKSIQQRVIEAVKKGQGVDLKDTEQVSTNIIDSVFRNPNALMFISQMKSKHEYLYQHSLNSAILMSVFAKYMGFDPEIIQRLTVGALLNDVGKLHIPASLIEKAGELTEQEFEIVKQHVDFSHEIAASLPGIQQESLDVVRLHHERLDGSGYPRGLKGDEINLYGRMSALIDSYDALTSDRCHKDAVAPVTAFKIMKNGTPGAYDTDLMAQLIRCIGAFPVGTLVKLKSQKLAIVTENNFDAPLSPKVTVFYSIRSGHHLEVKPLDLSAAGVSDEIEASVRPEDYNLNLLKFLKNSLL